MDVELNRVVVVLHEIVQSRGRCTSHQIHSSNVLCGLCTISTTTSFKDASGGKLFQDQYAELHPFQSLEHSLLAARYTSCSSRIFIAVNLFMIGRNQLCMMNFCSKSFCDWTDGFKGLRSFILPWGSRINTSFKPADPCVL